MASAALIDTPAPVPAAPALTWLDGGLALLAGDGSIQSTNDILALWLGAPTDSLPERSMAQVLGRINPTWEGVLQHFLDSLQTFGAVNLPGRAGQRSGWVRVHAVRAGSLITLHLDSTLPPHVELEEYGSGVTAETGRVERELRMRLLQAESQLDNLMRRWPGVIFSQRGDLSFHYASPRLEEFTGVPLSDWCSRPNLLWDLVHEADVNELSQQLARAVQEGVTVTTNFRIRHARSGRIAYVQEHRLALRSSEGVLLGFEGVWLDVTRQTIAERRLSTAAWRDTLAVLTMGLAHDFGNILAGIHALAETIEATVPAGEDGVRESIGLIKRNAMQASALVRRVLNLHQGKPGELGYADLNAQVTDLVELVRKVVPRRIQVEVKLSDAQLPIYVDAVELRQVFLNLAMNAVDAMPHSGRLMFTTSRHAAMPELQHMQGTFPRLPAVCLHVEDNGTGIPARNLGSIFDPFFTTKPMNKGAGLGLYNSRLFVEKHHGAISVDSTEGRGTTFHLWLPEADFTEQERQANPGVRRRRTLLLLGPPGRALETTTEFLRSNNYFVVTETREGAGIQLLDSLDYEFDAVLVIAGADADPSIGQILRDLRLRRPPIKSILQIVGRNEDEIDPRWIRDASLTLPPDLPEAQLQEKLDHLLEGTGL
jgi:PAS domain S-box-containing protein